jgi:hypothetical protein
MSPDSSRHDSDRRDRAESNRRQSAESGQRQSGESRHRESAESDRRESAESSRRGSPASNRRAWAVGFLVFLAAATTLFVAAARMPILTPDVWWHLATGRLIATSGIPHADPFSYTLAGHSWTAHEWLADRILYTVHAHGGLLGIVHLRAGLIVLAFAFAFALARLHAPAWLAFVTLSIAAWVSQRNWLDRPQLWSYALAPLLVLLLERHRIRPTRAIWALPLLFVLWANLHGGFMLGLGLVALWAALPERGASDGSGRPALRVAATLSVFAVLANPNGLHGALYPLQYVGAGLGRVVQEEMPGHLDSAYAWVHLGLVLALAFLLLIRIRSVTLPHLALGLLLGWISMPRLAGVALPFAAERHAPLFLLLGTPILAWQLAAILGPRMNPVAASIRRWGQNSLAGIAAAALAVAGLFLVLRGLPRDRSPEARLLPGRFPVEAAAWLRANALPGHLINPYRWGGYLEFELFPAYRAWIDSRGDLYGLARLRESELLQRMPPGSGQAVHELLERYDANVIVWPLLTLDFGPLQVHPFTDWLLRSGEWRLVFYDRPDARRPDRPAGVSGVFLREHPRNAAWLSRYAPQSLPPLPRARRPPS